MAKSRKPTKNKKDMKQQPQKTEKPPPPWSVVRGLFSCKHPQEQQQQMQERKQQQKQPQQQKQKQKQEEESGGQREAAHEQKLRMKERKHEHNQEKRSNEASEKCKKTKEKKHEQNQEQGLDEGSKKCKKMKCSGSLCSNTKVMHRPELAAPSPELQRKRANSSSSNNESSSRSMKPLLNEFNGVVSSTNSSLSANSSNNTNMSGTSSRGMPFKRFAGCYGCRMVVDPVSSTNSSLSANSSNNTNMSGTSSRGMPFRRFAGCYECRMVVDPVLGITRDPSLRSSICFCPECGEIFMKPESLDLHQAVRHAVSELSPEDTSKNIVEIIFQSSWLKKENPVCKIDRILKVHNTQRTISRFEEYRDSIKAKATKLVKKHPRCIADGNELLRFHSTTFSCSIGLDGSSNLCNSIQQCNVCSIIKNGFKDCTTSQERGILTTATSGKAHDKAAMILDDKSDRRAMLVCRVIAGRVKKSMEGNVEEYDSVAGAMGLYSSLDELYVFNPTAILPCFVVIYSGF